MEAIIKCLSIHFINLPEPVVVYDNKNYFRLTFDKYSQCLNMANFDKALRISRKFGFQIAIWGIISLMTTHFLVIFANFLVLVHKSNVFLNKLHCTDVKIKDKILICVCSI